jgi:hypothetical protein
VICTRRVSRLDLAPNFRTEDSLLSMLEASINSCVADRCPILCARALIVGGTQDFKDFDSCIVSGEFTLPRGFVNAWSKPSRKEKKTSTA